MASGLDKIWEILPPAPEDFKNKFPEIQPVILQLLYNRGLRTQKQIDEFLLPDYSQDLHDPFLFRDMKKAVDRIFQAVENKQKVIICGDYDADGITSTAVLWIICKKLGLEDATTYIPDRLNGSYGLTGKMIEDFIKREIDLIITCDCGITSVDEVELAKQSGIEVIITDHHRSTEKIPKAVAVINPNSRGEKYPFKHLAGVGVAFKMIQALLSDSRCRLENKEAAEKWLLDLVALGTVADCMPLLGENRTLVKYGLLVLNKTANFGIRSLVEKSGLELGTLSAEHLAYQLGPRINAASRIKHADEALKMILTEDKTEADKLAGVLNSFNSERQRLVESVFQEIKTEIGEEPKEKILVVLGNWPKGILGLIASKLVEQYFRPAVVLTRRDDEVVGSGRSILGFDLYRVLDGLSKYFIAFGGHAGALGLTLKEADFPDFKKEVARAGKEAMKEWDLAPKIKVDALVQMREVNWSLYEELKKFEPFGRSNFLPNFLIKNIRLNEMSPVGQNGQHCRLIVGEGKKMIYFSANSKVGGLKPGDKIDVIFQLGVNQWNGQQELQMKVVDLKKLQKY